MLTKRQTVNIRKRLQNKRLDLHFEVLESWFSWYFLNNRFVNVPVVNSKMFAEDVLGYLDTVVIILEHSHVESEINDEWRAFILKYMVSEHVLQSRLIVLLHFCGELLALPGIVCRERFDFESVHFNWDIQF